MAVDAFHAVTLPWKAPDGESSQARNARFRAAGYALGFAKLEVSEVYNAETAALIDSAMTMVSRRIERRLNGGTMEIGDWREAARRYWGYLSAFGGGDLQNVDIGEITLGNPPYDHSRAFRLSGARGIVDEHRINLAVSTWDEDDDDDD